METKKRIVAPPKLGRGLAPGRRPGALSTSHRSALSVVPSLVEVSYGAPSADNPPSQHLSRHLQHHEAPRRVVAKGGEQNRVRPMERE